MKKRGENYHDKFGVFYASKAWQDLRNRKFYDADGLCEMCRKDGVIREGKEVHHIVPIEDDWTKRLDYDNLILLCPTHHNEVHERQSEFGKFMKIWEAR